MIHQSNSLEETAAFAAKFIDFVSKNSSHTVFGFSGDLGSGKTAFTQCVARELGVTTHVTSPTFVIQKKYPIAREGFPFKTLIHIDAYRLESGKELETLGFKREMEDLSNLIIIEWPEKVSDIMPSDAPILQFSFVSEDVRTIDFPAMMQA